MLSGKLYIIPFRQYITSYGSLMKVKTHGGSDRIGARDAFASKTEDAREFKFKRRYEITQFNQL